MKRERVLHRVRGAVIICLAVFSFITFPTETWAHPFSANGILSIESLIQSAEGNSKEIQVSIQGGTLCQVLSDLEKKAQGFFKCPQPLDQIKVLPRTIQGSNWQSIVTQVLSDYNTIVLWKNENELESIYLLGFSSGSAAGTHAARAPKRAGGFLEVISKLRTQWANTPLSEELFNHPGFQEVFKMAQINSPEDWMDQKKQRRAKRELRQLYKTTQEKMKASKE
jgi:hypothetical protein